METESTSVLTGTQECCLCCMLHFSGKGSKKALSAIMTLQTKLANYNQLCFSTSASLCDCAYRVSFYLYTGAENINFLCTSLIISFLWLLSSCVQLSKGINWRFPTGNSISLLTFGCPRLSGYHFYLIIDTGEALIWKQKESIYLLFPFDLRKGNSINCYRIDLQCCFCLYDTRAHARTAPPQINYLGAENYPIPYTIESITNQGQVTH